MIAGLNAFDLAGIVTAVALIVVAIRTGRAEAEAPAPAEPLEDDYPTTPIPGIPPAPALPEMRLMLRRDELLWAKSGDDPDGVITLGLLPAPEGQLGVLVDDNGIAIGVRLDRHEVQCLRDAITNHLVASSKPVRP